MISKRPMGSGATIDYDDESAASKRLTSTWIDRGDAVPAHAPQRLGSHEACRAVAELGHVCFCRAVDVEGVGASGRAWGRRPARALRRDLVVEGSRPEAHRGALVNVAAGAGTADTVRRRSRPGTFSSADFSGVDRRACQPSSNQRPKIGQACSSGRCPRRAG